MPAKPGNKWVDLVYYQGETIKKFYVKTPYPFLVNVRPTYTEDAIACGINDSHPQVIYDLFSYKDQIIKQIGEEGFFIKDVSQMIFEISEICPSCQRKGVPSIVQKNTDTSYHKVSSESDGKRPKVKVLGKTKPFWLKFSHKTKPKTCWVQQWQGTNQGTFKPQIKKEQIDPRNYFISKAIQSIKPS